MRKGSFSPRQGSVLLFAEYQCINFSVMSICECKNPHFYRDMQKINTFLFGVNEKGIFLHIDKRNIFKNKEL